MPLHTQSRPVTRTKAQLSRNRTVSWNLGINCIPHFADHKADDPINKYTINTCADTGGSYKACGIRFIALSYSTSTNNIDPATQ